MTKPWLPDEIHSKLAFECRFAAKRMAEEKAPLPKLYFFSAPFSEINRLLNWQWDEDLTLIYVVMQATHTALNSRIAQPAAVPVNMERIMDQLTEATEELAAYVDKNLKNGAELCSIMARIAGLNYASTNHGSYIAQKGLLKI